MNTVIVPLDETPFSESILPFAARLAGDQGTVVLIEPLARHGRGESRIMSEDAVHTYLVDVAQALAAYRTQVQTKMYPGRELEGAIRDAVRELHGTMVAIASQARGHEHSLTWGDPAWHALAHSPVPVLLREGEESGDRPIETRLHGPSRLLVPLDGSTLAEKALPVATQLAEQWEGTIVLIRVADQTHASDADSYLKTVAGRLHVPTEVHVRTGSAEPELVKAALDLQITDIVMTSHGRTGLPRMLMGSVAAGLLHDLLVPIVIVPALATSHG